MTNQEADLRCQLAYEQLQRIFYHLCYTNTEAAKKLHDIMRQIVIFSELFNDCEGD